jgi:hypothetical protein
MDHHGPCQIMNISNPFLSDPILEMGIYSAVGNSLAAAHHVIDKQVLCKSAIVGMVMSNLDIIGGTVNFELSFGLQSLFRSRRLLNVQVGESTEVVDENGGSAISLGGEVPFHLSDEAGGRRFDLVDRDAVARFVDLDHFDPVLSCLGAPRSLSGLPK